MDAGAVAVVNARFEDERVHPALAVVVGGLQEGGGLPRVHRGVVEVELGHFGQMRFAPRKAGVRAWKLLRLSKALGSSIHLPEFIR